MKRLMAAVCLVILTAACGPTTEQLEILAKAKAQEKGWRPLHAIVFWKTSYVIACRETGEAQGHVYVLLMDGDQQLITENAIDATCEVTPTAK